MSTLFRKISWPASVTRYDTLRAQAKRDGLTLTVKNVSRTRGVPVFLFFLSRSDEDQARSFHSLDDVAATLAAPAEPTQ